MDHLNDHGVGHVVLPHQVEQHFRRGLFGRRIFGFLGEGITAIDSPHVDVRIDDADLFPVLRPRSERSGAAHAFSSGQHVASPFHSFYFSLRQCESYQLIGIGVTVLVAAAGCDHDYRIFSRY